MRQPLPAEWVDRIFQRLTVRYGQQFLRRWDGVDMAQVKADWADALAGFADKPGHIAHALGNLPTERPPTVGEFAAVANRYMPPAPRALPRPTADLERVAAELAKLRTATPQQYAGPKGWAYRLRDREMAGGEVPAVSRRMWREAIGEHLEPAA